MPKTKTDKSNKEIERIDQAIFEAEKEVEAGAKPIPLDRAKKKLNEKYLNK